MSLEEPSQIVWPNWEGKIKFVNKNYSKINLYKIWEFCVEVGTSRFGPSVLLKDVNSRLLT